MTHSGVSMDGERTPYQRQLDTRALEKASEAMAGVQALEKMVTVQITGIYRSIDGLKDDIRANREVRDAQHEITEKRFDRIEEGFVEMRQAFSGVQKWQLGLLAGVITMMAPVIGFLAIQYFKH
jgi:hypothetical protein